jgi:RNA polymerase-binding transcription factor DksA
MIYDDLEVFRRRLLGRRLALLRRREGALADEQHLLAELEPDWEDAAANESAASALESLGEAERLAAIRIQKALARMERGDYGECANCRGSIDEERLRAVPETEVCGGCAAAR